MVRRRIQGTLAVLLGAIAALAVSAPASSANEHTHQYVHWHIDAYGGWGDCKGVPSPDSQNNYTSCTGTTQPGPHSEPFTGTTVFTWLNPPVARCTETQRTKELGYTKQVLVSKPNAHDVGVLRGFTNQTMSAPALVVPGNALKLHGHWHSVRTGTDLSKTGHPGGPLVMHLIHHRTGSFGLESRYTMGLRGWLEIG